jgi:hypothetical protein
MPRALKRPFLQAFAFWQRSLRAPTGSVELFALH